ncbi:MAG: DUF2497 domain-containing protein [Alphaproteobacteria bacterium]|jgi:hypothetical protein|nr:DUF2497 domain-containing protein [Alphaproteobacteria bacterium]
MNNSSLPKLKIQNMQKKREIDSMLERDISGIVNKKRSGNLESIKKEVNENIANRLRSFLDERLNRGGEGVANTKNYSQQNSRVSENYYDDDDYDDDDNYYNHEDDDFEDEYDDEPRDRRRENPNSYLPFAYEDFKPEAPNEEELEEMILDAVMPSIAQWLDLNIDRIVHKVVKESLQNRGMPEGEPARYNSVRRYNDAPEVAEEPSNRYRRGMAREDEYEEEHYSRRPRRGAKISTKPVAKPQSRRPLLNNNRGRR